jgi:hypothetical protein
MLKWLFNSFGVPIAFVGMNNLVFHQSGTFIGLFDDGKIWDKHGKYVGEIVTDNRLFRSRITVHQPKLLPMLPYEPNIPNLPSDKNQLMIPPGFIDIEFDGEGFVIF